MRKLLIILLLFPAISQAQKLVPKFENDTLYTTSGFKIYKGQSLQFGKGEGWGGSFRFIRLIGAGSDKDIFTGNTLVVKKLLKFGVSPIGNYYIHVKGYIKFKDGSTGQFGFNFAFEKAIEYSVGPTSELIVPDEFKNKTRHSDSEEISKLYKLYQDSIITKEEFEMKKKKLLGIDN